MDTTPSDAFLSAERRVTDRVATQLRDRQEVGTRTLSLKSIVVTAAIAVVVALALVVLWGRVYVKIVEPVEQWVTQGNGGANVASGPSGLAPPSHLVFDPGACPSCGNKRLPSNSMVGAGAARNISFGQETLGKQFYIKRLPDAYLCLYTGTGGRWEVFPQVSTALTFVDVYGRDAGSESRIAWYTFLRVEKPTDLIYYTASLSEGCRPPA